MNKQDRTREILSFFQSNLLGDGRSQRKSKNLFNLDPVHYLYISLGFTSSYLFLQFISTNLVLQIFLVLAIITLPGMAIMQFRVIDFETTLLNFFFSILLSIVSVMFLFFLLTQILWIFGLEKNCSNLIVGFYINLLISLSCLVCARNVPNLDQVKRFKISGSGKRFFLATLGLIAFSIHATLRLNEHSSSVESIFLTTFAFLFLIVLVRSKRVSDNSGLVFWALWIFSYVLLLSSTLRGGYGFYGYDINSEYNVADTVVTTHSWSIGQPLGAYGSMLSITLLPAVLAFASKFSILIIFKFFYSALAALIPAVLFEFTRRFAGNRQAIISIYALILGSISFFNNFPALNRQIIGLMLFLGIWIIVFQDNWSFSRRKRFIALLFFGLSFSHYSSSYLLAAMALLTSLAYFIFVTFDLFSAVTSGRIQQAFSTHRQRIFTLPFAILLVLVTLSWNGVITHSSDNIQGLISKLSSGKTGLGLLPTKDKNLLTRYLQGTSTRNLNSADYRRSVMLSLAVSHPEFQLRPESFHYDMKKVDPPVIKPLFGSTFSYLIAQAENFAKLWYQAIIVSITFVLIWIFLSRRRLPSEDPIQNSNSIEARSTIQSELSKFMTKSNSVKTLYDFAGLTFSGFLLAVLLRSSGLFAAVYNPDRAALQIAIVWVLPFALFMEFISERRILGKFLRFITGLVACILLFGVSGLAPFFDSSFVARIYEKNSIIDPQLISHDENYAAKWVSAKLYPEDRLQMDGLAVVNFLKFKTKAQVFANIAPFVLDQSSFIFENGPNKLGHVAYDRALYNSYIFPSDYIDKYYLPVFVTDKTALYR